MILSQLPRFHLSIFTKPPSSSLSSPHFNFLNHRSNPPVSLARAIFSFAPKSNLATVEPIPLPVVSDSSDLDEAPVEISLDKLFIPPETDISGDDPSSLTARILKGSNIVLSRYARDAQVAQADYVKSSVRTEDCPADGLPEFALVGRSNVGKSSLLNSLVRRKRLALTSKKPGKTQCINHFRINDNWYLVDLPGYGYASAPHELKQDWNKFTKDYFLNRSTLVSVFLLVDASIPPKQIDLDYASWLGQNQVPMTMVFTKCDKRKKKKNGGKRPEENIKEFQDLIQGFFETTPPWIMTSSVTNQGRDEILLHMAQLRNYWLKH
ncbi:GTP-binding protein At2g22870 [Brassica rapa]|uniref:EngB-type G domain-containing protein n=1 Tax=Brassica campestris TaxID=3711 RepID=M4CXL1_BRACM|nr:GTP-binding protein At2g22870 [Brassica rapa]